MRIIFFIVWSVLLNTVYSTLLYPYQKQLLKIHGLAWYAMIENLSPAQERQIERYIELLLTWNAKFNLTSITAIPKIRSHHFQDSLYLADFVDFTQIKTLVDVGTGAGFPGLPLKIVFPHLHVILIEVNQKKIRFLQEVVQELGLTNVEIYPHDWRTFLRTTEHQVDLVCARASLHPDELLRMFKSACPYKNAQLVYWASEQWQSTAKERTYITREETYAIDNKKRRYVFFLSGVALAKTDGQETSA